MHHSRHLVDASSYLRSLTHKVDCIFVDEHPVYKSVSLVELEGGDEACLSILRKCDIDIHETLQRPPTHIRG